MSQPGVSCPPHLLVHLHSWLPQVPQAQPLHVKHHQHHLDLSAQLHRTEQGWRSGGSSSQEPLAAETPSPFPLLPHILSQPKASSKQMDPM